MLAKIAKSLQYLSSVYPVKILGGSHLLTESYLPDKQKDSQFGFP